MQTYQPESRMTLATLHVNSKIDLVFQVGFVPKQMFLFDQEQVSASLLVCPFQLESLHPIFTDSLFHYRVAPRPLINFNYKVVSI